MSQPVGPFLRKCRSLLSTAIARELKRRGEQWSRKTGATFLNTNVQIGIEPMLAINANAGFTLYRYNLRKRLL